MPDPTTPEEPTPVQREQAREDARDEQRFDSTYATHFDGEDFEPRYEPRLEDGVDRLSGSTKDLAVVLDRLNETRARLDLAEMRTERLDAEAVRDADLRARDVLERRARRLLYLSVFGGLAVLVLVIAMVSHAGHGTCERRQEAVRAISDVLISFEQPGSPGNAKIEAGVDRLEQTLDRTCDEQYPIHF